MALKIILLKEKKEPDQYLKALEDRGIGRVEYIPVLSINLINQEELKNHLLGQKFTHIIFTSGNSVKAVENLLKESKISHYELSQLKCYVVGKSTEKLATNIGFNCCGDNTGNAEDLARLIITDNRANGGSHKYLFPCGQMKREALPNLMMAEGYDLTCVTAYVTSERPLLSEKITASVDGSENSETIAVFFSPSGVTFALSKFLSVYRGLHTLHCSAIGKSTAEELVNNGVEPCCVAERPTAESLATAIQSFVNTQFLSRQDESS